MSQLAANVTAVFVNNQYGIKRRGQDFDKKGYTAKRLTDEFTEKSWTKRVVNKLLKKLRATGTVDRRPSSSTPRSARNCAVPESKKMATPSYAQTFEIFC